MKEDNTKKNLLEKRYTENYDKLNKDLITIDERIIELHTKIHEIETSINDIESAIINKKKHQEKDSKGINTLYNKKALFFQLYFDYNKQLTELERLKLDYRREMNRYLLSSDKQINDLFIEKDKGEGNIVSLLSNLAKITSTNNQKQTIEKLYNEDEDDILNNSIYSVT
jgi:hypothetical protein